MSSDPKFDELLKLHEHAIQNNERCESRDYPVSDTDTTRADLVAHHEATMRQSGTVSIPAELAMEWREAKATHRKANDGWLARGNGFATRQEVSSISKSITDKARCESALFAAIEAAAQT